MLSKKGWFIATVCCVILPVLFVCFSIAEYMFSQHKSVGMISACKESESKYVMETGEYKEHDECYARMFNLLLPYLLVYDVKLKDPSLPMDFIRLDKDSKYNVPKFVIGKTEALIGYGVGRTCRFEDNYQRIFEKPAYAYDCGNLTNICKTAKFQPECVGTGKNATTYKSATEYTHPKVEDTQIHEFIDEMEQIGLGGKKKVFVKMNIVGAEDKVMKGILKHSGKIPVIVLYIHIKNPEMMINKFKTLDMLNKKYYLVARSIVPVGKVKTIIKPPVFSNKYVKGEYSRNISLTYINKKLVEDAHISCSQDDTFNYFDIDRLKDDKTNRNMHISWVVAASEKLKQWFGISYE